MLKIKVFICGNERHRFLVIGAFNAVFGYLCFAVLYKFFSEYMNYIFIGILAHIIAVTNAFYLQRNLVFRATGSVFSQFIRYNIATLGSLSASIAGMSLLVGQFRMNVLLSQALLIGLLIMLNYFSHKHFTFKKILPKN